MADSKISELDLYNTISGNEEIAFAKGGANGKLTMQTVLNEARKDKVESEGYDSVVGDLEANLLTDALRKTPQVLSESEQQTARANIGAQGQLTTSADLALSSDDVLSLTDMAKKRLFIDLWNEAAGARGRYNEETGYFELCEIYNIGWSEALRIFKHSYGMGLNDMDYFFDIWSTGYGTTYPRVFLPLKQSFANLNKVANINLKNDFIEYLAFSRGGSDERTVVFNVQSQAFMLSNVKKIYDIVGISQIAANDPNIFNMPKLEYARFKLWGSNYTTIYFSAPLLDYASTSYLFNGISTQNANGQCVFKLAANMYNRLSGTATDYASSGGTKEEWMALADLATSKNITLATA